MNQTALARVLAQAMLAAGPSASEMAARAAATLGHRWRWLGPLSRRFQGLGLRHREAIRLILEDPGFARHWRRLRIATWLHEPPVMRARWDVPSIATAGDLARWLSLADRELEWYADLKGLNRGRLSHYTYRRVQKGHGEVRMLEAPKPLLRQLQRQILTEILDKIPAHGAAHGFVKGRSIQSFVTPHVRKAVVLKMDLKDFFPSIPGVRIQAFFRTAGYPEGVADLLGGLCTNALERGAPDLYRRPHLPQGAPTSPSLANFCAYRMDCRLTGLTRSLGIDYTRYADDLAFSGDVDFERLSTHNAGIAQEEGFAVNHRKTRVMRQGVRQRLAGLTANAKVNVIRADFDILKATLTNCVRLGPESQNREGHPDFRAHLEGRVGFVESINPVRGQRLREILDRVSWRVGM